MYRRRSLCELLDEKDPCWPIVSSWIAAAKCPVEILPVVDDRGAIALEALQVTTHSALGAVVYSTGGILVDHGWLRILGSGHSRLPRSPAQWNLDLEVTRSGLEPPFMLIADDVVGGFFAMDGGKLGFQKGEVAYFAPDTMKWEPLGRTYLDFLQWALSGNLSEFYGDYRWPEWQKDVKALRCERAYSIYPFPGFKGPPISERSRKDVPVEELFHLYQDLGRQVRDLPDGTTVELRIQDE